MRRRHLLAGFLALLLTWPVAFPPSARAGDSERDTDAILSAAESLFTAMQDRDDRRTWELLTGKSRDAIARATARTLGAAGATIPSDEALRRDFADGGPIARSYWDGFLARFDPRMALEESRWAMGEVGRDEAMIIITYKNAEQPVRLRMAHEELSWRVGLIETFR